MKKRVTLLGLIWLHVRYLLLNQSTKYLVHSFINDQYIPGMYVRMIDPNTHTTLSPLLSSSPLPPLIPRMHIHTQPSNPTHLSIQTYTSSSASTSYHQFPYYSPRTLHRLWDNTGHQWRLERDTCRRFCSLGRIDRWIFRRRGIGTGWGRWVSRRGEKKFIVCEKKKEKGREHTWAIVPSLSVVYFGTSIAPPVWLYQSQTSYVLTLTALNVSLGKACEHWQKAFVSTK